MKLNDNILQLPIANSQQQKTEFKPIYGQSSTVKEDKVIKKPKTKKQINSSITNLEKGFLHFLGR
jgi:hypothetical protein